MAGGGSSGFYRSGLPDELARLLARSGLQSEEERARVVRFRRRRAEHDRLLEVFLRPRRRVVVRYHLLEVYRRLVQFRIIARAERTARDYYRRVDLSW